MHHALKSRWARTALIGGGAAYAAWYRSTSPRAYAAERSNVKIENEETMKHGECGISAMMEKRRVYTAAQVREGCEEGRRVWVSYGDGVYDITKFVEMHPGGNQILEAAGGPVEPFWEIYAQHDEPFVRELLEEYRIGDLAADDVAKVRSKDPYANEPTRSDMLVVRSGKPFNAEPKAEDLIAQQVTRADLFYVRNHLPVPKVDVDTYRLRIFDVQGNQVGSLCYEDLRKLPKHSVAATVQCAGNRRDEMSETRAVKGGSWGACAIGNAEWSGARLIDVLPESALRDAQHVCFDGLDKDPATGAAYGASVPIDVLSEVILAYEMNGETLTADHGYPVRAIVPGVVGARNVKWLSTIELSESESDSHWQRRDYKGFSPNIGWDNADWDSAAAIQELPVTSAICKCTRDDHQLHVEGYAWSGGGRGIIRVDVSIDGGENWATASLREKQEQRNRVYDWTLWHVQLPVDDTVTEVLCKATDSSYNTQPERVDPIWNLRGVLNNAWHRVDI